MDALSNDNGLHLAILGRNISYVTPQPQVGRQYCYIWDVPDNGKLLIPILVRMMDARVGSTLAMQLLATSPAVAMDRDLRFEHSYLTYFAMVARQFEHFRPDDASATGFVMEELVYDGASAVGALPFTPQIVRPTDLRLAGLAALWGCFSGLVRQNHPGVSHYAEKFWGDVQPVLDGGLHPVVIDLVRDPRDVVASHRSFNDRNGGTLFRRAEAESEDFHLRRLITTIRMRLNEMSGSLATSRFTVRYEDLVLEPNDFCRHIDDLCGLRLRPELVNETTATARVNMTSPSAAASVGRWRRDLDQATIGLIEGRLAGPMERLGYEVSTSNSTA